MPLHLPCRRTATLRATPLAVALLLTACATSNPGTSPAPSQDALACTLPSNCVSTASGAAPLRFDGTPAQALERLRATLASFPQARTVPAEGLVVEAVFSTPAGFKDVVDFRIDPAQQRIEYRSRSTFGLYDFGKNRARMQQFAERFAATPGR